MAHMFDSDISGAGPKIPVERPYSVVMTVSAHDVAAVLRNRLPGLPTKKLHKLLYYCQGHHLATFNVPLFAETISAWDMGPVVGTLWFAESRRVAAPSPRPLDEAQLNTVGYVVSRYGALSGRDLENLTHNESPWQLADLNRTPGTSTKIRLDWIRDHFTTTGSDDTIDDGIPLDSAAVTAWLKDAEPRPSGETLVPDSIDEFKSRLANRG
jgi:uncharacterized phage-associated protein